MDESILTDRVLDVMKIAAECARSLGEDLRPEHVMKGLFEVRKGIASKVLRDHMKVRTSLIEEMIAKSSSFSGSERMEVLFDNAKREAKLRHHGAICTDLILIAALRDPEIRKSLSSQSIDAESGISFVFKLWGLPESSR